MPLLIVVDDDPARRAQDFVDLQRNAKPPSGSLGSSMDRRHAINRFTLDIAKVADLTDGGQRVEFLKDTVGKLSGKLYTFQAFRQFVVMLMIGSSQRTRAGLEKAADEAVANGHYQGEFDRVLDLLNTAAHAMPGWAEIIDGSSTVAEVWSGLSPLHGGRAGTRRRWRSPLPGERGWRRRRPGDRQGREDRLAA